MFKPRLRIPQAGLLRSSSSSTSHPSPLLAAAIAKPQQHQQQRSIHASSPVRHWKTTHDVPSLNPEIVAKGVPELYTQNGFNAAYTSYMEHCLENLKRLTDGTPLESKDILDVIKMTAREPGAAHIFNFASMAWNNHFFFQSLATSNGTDKSEYITPELQAELEKSFGSMETLQREMLLTAHSMFGPGYVWLVRQMDAVSNQRNPFKVLATYHAGTPFQAAHYRRQASFRDVNLPYGGADMNNVGGLTDVTGNIVKQWQNASNQAIGQPAMHDDVNMSSSPYSVGAFDAATKSNPNGTHLLPVLCVNTWEHAYMFDWGVRGKWNYLAAWWNRIHWGVVAERSAHAGSRSMSAEAEIPMPPLGNSAAL